MQKKQKTYKPICVLIFFLLLLGCLFLFYLRWVALDDYSVEIDTPNVKIIHPLYKNKQIPVQGSTGKVIVEIKNHKVHIISSNCPDKTCIKTGFISNPGPMILCAPNRVLVRIIRKSPKKGDSTLVTY